MQLESSSNGVTPLANLAEIRLGVAYRSRLDHDPSGDVAILQMKDIDESVGPSYASATRALLGDDKRHLLVREGDLVFRSRGRSTGAALVGPGAPPAILAAPLLLIRPRPIVLPEFLWWFINSEDAQAQLASVTVGTSVQMINAASLRSLQVPVPPMEAQRRIAEVAQLVRHEEELMNQIIMCRKQLTAHVLLNYARQGAKGVNR